MQTHAQRQGSTPRRRLRGIAPLFVAPPERRRPDPAHAWARHIDDWEINRLRVISDRERTSLSTKVPGSQERFGAVALAASW